ncbi:unnamed protein product [Rotaria sordida]|uniref:Uncharacterized protein n=1 Tax=Rotaria sordida TaxID=392033 RepID=A0A815EGI0_9BILA|nr:unnamed protein product [Rotaria sordida]
MSSINFIPKTSNYLPNINIPPLRPYYLTANIPPPNIQPNYQNLTRQIPRKPSLYGAGQRKYNSYKKFQTGTTTTFNGYTNLTGIPPIPPPRRRQLPPSSSPYRHNYHHHNHHNHNYHPSHYNRQYHHHQNNINNLPTLMSLNPFHLPSHHHTRSFHQAQHFHPNQHQPRSVSRSRFHILGQLPSKSRSRSRSFHRPQPPPIKPRRVHQQQHNSHHRHQHHNNFHNFHRSPSPSPSFNINNNNNNNIKRTFKGIILSDSMCSRLRTYAIKKLPLYDVDLSYESGCDIYNMIQWLNTPEGRGKRRRHRPTPTAPTTPTTTTTLQMNNNIYVQRQYQPRQNYQQQQQQQNRTSTSDSENSNSEEEEEEDNRKRKLQDTSISPTSKGKILEKENIIRKKKIGSKKKKKVAIENDPRAPEGSPILLVSENSNKEKTDQIAKKTRADTPIDKKEKHQPWNTHVHVRKPQRVRIQQQELFDAQIQDSSTELPKTPPGLNDPPPISPRQSTPKTPIAPPRPLVYSPNFITSNIENEKEKENHNNPPIVTPRIRSTIEIEEQDHQMEQDSISHSPSVIPKDSEINRINLFNFPIVPIECKFHFKIFHLKADTENIRLHQEFLEKKSKQQEKELEEMMKQFSEDLHRIIIRQ